MNLFDLFARITLDTSEYDNGLENASQRTQGFGSKLKSGLATAGKVGAAAIGVASAAVVGFAKSSLDAGMSFDATMSKVKAISGATGSEFDRLRDKALEMGSKTKFSASESTEALTYMAMAGWKTGDMLGGIEGIMNLAAASGEDLASTSDIVTDALTAFGMQASESGRFADILAVASSNANTNVGLMGETFKYVAPVAGAMGYSAEDTALAIGLMANSGIKASQAGTSLRAIFNRLATDAGASSKKLGALGVLTKELGVEFYDAEGNARDFNSVLMKSREAWQGLTDEQQINFASTIAGQEAMSGWLALMNASEADVKKLSSAIEECDGAAQKMADTMNDNLAGDITLFNSALESAKIIISDGLTPTLRDFVQFGTDAVGKLSTAFKEGGLTGAMEALGEILSDGLAMVIEKLPLVIEAGMALLGALIEGIISNLPALAEAAGKIIASLAENIKESLPKMAESAGSAIENFAKGISEALPTLIPAAVEIILSLVDAITQPDTLSAIIDAGFSIILGLANGLMQALPELLARAPEILGHLVAAWIEFIPKFVVVGVQIIGGLILGLIQAIPDLLLAIPRVIQALIEGFCEMLGIHSPSTVFAEIGANIIAGLLEGIVNAWENIIAFFAGAVEALIGFLGGAWEIIRQAAATAWEAIALVFAAAWQTIQSVWSGVVAFFSAVWQGIESVFSVAADVLSGFFSAAWEVIQAVWNIAVSFFAGIWQGIQAVFAVVPEVLGKFFSDAWQAIKKVWETVTDFFEKIGEGIQQTFSDATEAVAKFFEIAADMVKAAWQGLVQFFVGVWEGIKGIFSDTVDFFGNIFSKAAEGIKSAWDGITGFFKGIWDGIVHVFSNVWEHFTSVGAKIVEGIQNGIQNAWNGFVKWISGLAGGVVDTILGWFGAKEEKKTTPAKKAATKKKTRIQGSYASGLDYVPKDMVVQVHEGEAILTKKENAARNKSVGDTFIFNSPKALDPVSAAREMKKAKQQLALGYV